MLLSVSVALPSPPDLHISSKCFRPSVLLLFSSLLLLLLASLALGVLVGFFCQALELISNDVGPDEPSPSPGNKNPAVMKYDPTGLRTTMSTSGKAWEESLKVRCGWADTQVDRCLRARVFGVECICGWVGGWVCLGRGREAGRAGRQFGGSAWLCVLL